MKLSVAPLGEICEINIGKTPPRERSEYWAEGSPWLSIADMNQGRDLVRTKETISAAAIRNCHCRLVSPGTVLLSFKLSIGKVGIARVPMCTNEAIAALPIRDLSRISPQYLYWALKSTDLTQRLDRAAKGVTLNKPKLRRIPVPLPSISQQGRIVDMLDRADALRAKRRLALDRIDTLAKATFVDVFGDPISNSLAWQTVPLRDLLTIPLRNGQSPSKSGSVRSKVLTLSAVTGDAFDTDAWKWGTFQHEPSKSRSVMTDDLLICRGNPSSSS